MRIDRCSFHSALKELSRIIDQSTPLPILKSVALDARRGTLVMKATDLKRCLVCRLPADGKLTTCLPAKSLSSLTKPEGKKPSGNLEIEQVSENQVSLKVDGLETRIFSSDPADFPAGIEVLVDQDWQLVVLLPSKEFGESLDHVLPAASSDETSPNLCAVFLSERKMIATNGRRLHMVTDLRYPVADPLLVPADSAATVRRLLPHGDPVVITRAGNVARFRMGPMWQLDTALIESKFQNYRQFVPSYHEQPVHLTVNKRALIKALDRLGCLSTGNTVKMRVNGAIVLSVVDPDLGEVEVAVSTIASNHIGRDIVMGFNSAYLRDGLRKADTTIELSFGSPLAPMRMDLDEVRTAVIAPVQV